MESHKQQKTPQVSEAIETTPVDFQEMKSNLYINRLEKAISLIDSMRENIPFGFERRAFLNAARFILSQKDSYQLSRVKGGMRKKISKFNLLTIAYIEEIENYITDKDCERFTAQALFGIDFNATHNISSESFTGIIDLVLSKLNIFADKIDFKSIISSAVMCILNVWANLDRPATVMLSIGQFLMTLNLGQELLTQATTYFVGLYEKIRHWFSSISTTMIEKFSMQMKIDNELEESFDISGIIPYIGSAISMLLSLVCLRILPGGKSLEHSLFNRFSKLSGVIKSANDVSKLFGDVFTNALDYFCLHAFGIERPAMDEWKNIRAWTDEVTSLITPDFENNLKGSEHLKQKIESLLQQGMNVLRTLDLLKVPMNERANVSQCVLFLMRVRETAGGCGAGQTKPRVAPAITHIFGHSGVGKSTVLWALIAEIQAALGVTKESDLHEKTYFRRPGAKFWDGYNNGVNVVVCDDFGALVDSENSPNEEFLEAIHMSNTAFWQLNMAELSDKRSTFFQAKSVIWTSNRSHFSVVSLTNPEAVLRRVDIKIRQKAHPDFAMTQKQGHYDVVTLDQRKVNEAIAKGGKNAMLDCVLFDVIDKDCPNDSVLEANLTFWDIAERVVNKTISNMNYFENFNKALVDHMGDAISRCSGGVWKRPSGASSVTAPSFTMQLNDLKPSDCEVNHKSYIQKLKETVGPKYNHVVPANCNHLFDIELDNASTDVDKKMIQLPIASTISDHERFAAGLILNSKCFVMEHSKLEKFTRCYVRAKRAYDILPKLEKTNGMFINLYVASCRDLQGEVIPIFEHELCSIDVEMKETSWISSLKSEVSKLHEKVEKKFPISPAMFYTLVGVGSLISFFIGKKIYKEIASFYKRRQTNKLSAMRYESTYDTDKTKAMNKLRIEGNYDVNKTKAAKNLRMEYATDVTKSMKKMTVESYSTDVTKSAPKMRTEGDSFKMQAVVDQNAAEVVNILFKNMYRLEYFEGGQWNPAMNLTIIRGRLALVNRHLMVKAHINQWRIRNSYFADGIEFSLKECNFTVIDDPISPYYRRDVMMLELPRVVHQHRDITSKFMTGDDFSKFKTLDQISMIGFVPSGESIVMRQYFGNDVLAVDSDFDIDDGKNVVMRVRKIIKYNIQSTPGDCGAVLVAFDKNFNNKIFGIHSGGTVAPRWTGFGTPVTTGLINALYNGIELDFPESHMSPDLPCAEDKVSCEMKNSTEKIWKQVLPFEGNFYHLGEAPERIHANVASRIRPSPVHGIIQKATMAPAKLGPFTNSKGERIDPMVNARAKASPISKPLDNQILDSCLNDYFQLLQSMNGDSDKKVLTHEEGISGIVGDNCYPPMKRSTSPGYGWSKSGKGKTNYLGTDEYVYDHPEVLAALDNLLTKCKNGERPSIVWSDTLKDERRTLDKVDKGKTRLFSCGEMAYTILFRRYFGGFIAFMMRNKIDVESCVGTNVYSMDWTRIVDKLQEKGSKILAGDFANYDGTLHPTILWAMCDFINKWYDSSDDMDDVIRVALWSEVVNSIHITGNRFYMWNHSQPSGCPMTVILNCLYHSISARYVYIVCARKYSPKDSSLATFRKYVSHLNYGDDDLWSINDAIVSWFNQVTITEAYTTLGMTYTDEAKTGDVVPYRKLTEVNFLKRVFRWDDVQCRYRAPLSLETVREMAMWVHGTTDHYELTANTLQDAVRELAQHDRTTFRKEMPAFERAAQVIREKFPVYFETYDQYQMNEAINLEE